MRAIHKLSDRKVRNAKEGLHGDGGGLILQVTTGAAGQLNHSWLFRFVSPVTGKERRMGLGAYPTISLNAAREAAASARKLLAAGVDPLDAKASTRAPQPAVVTFNQCVDGYFNAHQVGWSPKHAQVWRASLDNHVTFGRMPVGQIDTVVVLKDLEPLWLTQPELASRLRGRIEQVLDWARAREFRTGENPARWGHLKHLLAKKSSVHKVEHFAAMPYDEIGGFVQQLRQLRGTAPRALEFIVLTAVRTGEVLGARWDEIQGNTWVIPAERMKGGKEHRVPLSDAAMRILEQQAKVRESNFIFAGQRRNTLTSTVMPDVLRRAGRPDIDTHGFRSTFRGWAGSRGYPRELAEMALAHAIGNAVEQAYMRDDLLAQRRELMAAWAAFIEAPASAGAAAHGGGSLHAA